jgi:hypothetical protein
MEGTDEGDRAAEEAAEARKEGLEKLGETYTDIMQTRDSGKDEGSDLGVDFSQERTDENISQAVDDLAAQYDAQVKSGQRQEDANVQSDVNKAKEMIGMPQQLGDVGGSMDKAPSGPTGPTGKDIHGGDRPGQGGNGNGNGKGIVCTAMYQTTGLEDWSKAMKIWYIYQQKYLTIQHQEGYHKLFKPFVKGMYKSKIIKAIGAHVAKHRTQHLKHVMFNSKPSLLGKIYNKILEPICYWVGKYAKR